MTLSEEDIRFEAETVSAVANDLDGGTDYRVNADSQGQIPFDYGGELVLFEEYGGGTWSLVRRITRV